MPELTERTGAGSGQLDDCGTGIQASRAIQFKTQDLYFFLLFKMKGPGTGVCLVSMYNASY
jgi:hypothetical protein